MAIQTGYKTSVNIKFDIGNSDFVNRYLPTPSHADSLIGLAEGFINKNSNTAHIMIGPYGSGKSLVATIVADFVSKAIESTEINHLINKFDKVHQDIYQSLKQLNQLDRTYIPITFSGSEGTFSEVIITSIIRSLHDRGIHIQLAGEGVQIINTVGTWQNDYPQSFSMFTNLLSERKIDISVWLTEIEAENKVEIDWFKSIYPLISAGAEFYSDNRQMFFEKMESIVDVLHSANIGLFIIYDEFGRFLQNLSNAEIFKTMQDIQDLAELASRSKGVLHVLLISHKSMSQYMHGFHEEYRSEFQRIEKRFTTYFVESDSATYYRVAEQYTSEMLKTYSIQPPFLENSKMTLRKYDLFQELNQQEVERIIIEGSYPLHPITLFLLPRISKVFGQNERTLFTFLESEETGGLRSHIRQSNEYYYPDNLFVYFFVNNIDMYIGHDSHSSLNTYKKILKSLSKNKKNNDLFRIIHIIALWELSNSNGVYRLDDELISYATGFDSNKVKDLLKSLTKMKFIRFNRVLNQWELHEGSSLIIEEMIQNQREMLKISLEDRIAFLHKLLAKKYFLANEYNDKKNITRFMKVKLITSKNLLSDTFSDENELGQDADGYIYFILLEDKREYSLVIKKIEGLTNNRIIYCVIPEGFDEIQWTIEKEMICKNLLSNKKMLSEHASLEEELLILQEESLHEISMFLKKYITFDRDAYWSNAGAKLLLHNEIELENVISKIMFEEYPLTPVIMNDSVNRMKVNGLQQRALFKLLDGILKEHDSPNFGIEGQGPDYLIYATVYKNNNFNINSLDNIPDQYLKELRISLLEKIQQYPKGNLQELVAVFEKSPFGIRAPLIPLLFVSLLRDRWEQFMFYRNSIFVPALGAEKIYEMFKEPAEYDYEFHHYSDEMVQFLEGIEKMVSSFISEYVMDKPPLIKVSSGLVNWLRHLPRHTQTTDNHPDELIELKEIIRRIEINPLESIDRLKEIYQGDTELLKDKLGDIENSYRRFKVEVEAYLCKKLSLPSISEKKDILKRFSSKKISSSRILSLLSEANDIESFAGKYIGTEMQNWSDVTYELFQRQIENDLLLLDDKAQEVESKNTIHLSLDDKHAHIRKVELSTKSKVIYENVNRIIRNAGRNVPREEINFIIYKLLEEYIE